MMNQKHSKPRPGYAPPVEQLTPIEAKVWDLVQAGKTYDEIGQELGMKVISVRRRLPVIREKLACQ